MVTRTHYCEQPVPHGALACWKEKELPGFSCPNGCRSSLHQPFLYVLMQVFAGRPFSRNAFVGTADDTEPESRVRLRGLRMVWHAGCLHCPCRIVPRRFVHGCTRLVSALHRAMICPCTLSNGRGMYFHWIYRRSQIRNSCERHSIISENESKFWGVRLCRSVYDPD